MKLLLLAPEGLFIYSRSVFFILTSALTERVARLVLVLLSDRRIARTTACIVLLIGALIAAAAAASLFVEVPIIHDDGSARALSLLLAGALILASLAAFVLPVHEWAGERVQSELRSERIDKLASALKDASALVAAIERDISVGTQRVSELQTDIDTNRQLSELSAKEVEAVKAALQQTTSAERTFNVVLGLVFFILGIGASIVVAALAN